MVNRALPHDRHAETAIVAAALTAPGSVLPDARAAGLNASDFGDPKLGGLWRVMEAQYDAGHLPDPVTVHDGAQADGIAVTIADLLRLQGESYGLGNGGRWARIILRDAALRRLHGVASDLSEAVYEAGADPLVVADKARTSLSQIELPADLSRIPAGLSDVDTIVDAPPEATAPWAIEGLVRQDWRVVIVAEEGAGKTQLMRQLPMCAAQGVHPLYPTRRIRPITALIVDAENPDEHLRHTCGLVARPLRQMLGAAYQPGRVHLFSRKQGLNLRNRSARAELHSVLTVTKPDVVCIGPIYKLGRRTGKDSPEEAAEEVQEVLDDARTRFGFGLIMEGHAPKQTGNAVREMEPYGSQRWMGWPEIGLGLRKDRDNSQRLIVERFRGDRLPCAWPQALERGTQLPFTGRWDKNPWGDREQSW